MLRLLAHVISDLYQRQDNEHLIQLGSINLASSELRGELVRFIGNTFPSVVQSDIAGKEAKARDIDRQLGSEYAKESVSEKLARAIFLYSFGGGHQRGATLPQLHLAVMNPEMAAPFVPDALGRMTKRLWYLDFDSGLYWPNGAAGGSSQSHSPAPLRHGEGRTVDPFLEGVPRIVHGGAAPCAPTRPGT